MNIVIDAEFNKQPENGDILVYQKGKWVNLPKKEYLYKLNKEVDDLKNRCDELENNYKELIKLVKELRGEDNEESD